MDIDKQFKRKIKRLVLSLGVGEVAIASTSVTDFLAISLLGVETIAGYSFAVSFILLIYTINSIHNKITIPLYAKNKDIPEIVSYTIMSETLLVLSIVFICAISPLIVGSTNLSDTAKAVVLPVILIRGIGTIIYTATCTLYVYLRTNNYEKESGRGRIYCAITNIILDFVAIVFNTGVIGVAIATALSELVELIYIAYLILYKLKKKIKRRHLRLKRVDIKSYLAETVNTLILNIMDFTSTYIVTSLGDTGYAIYSLLYNLSDLVLYFVYCYQSITTIIYSEFSTKITKMYCKLQKEFIKYSIVWWVISCPLMAGVAKILTYKNGLEINIIAISIMHLLYIILYQIGDYSLGVMRIHKQYKEIIVLHIVASIVLLTSETILLQYTNNPYIIISAWYLYYLVKAIYLHITNKKETINLEENIEWKDFTVNT